MIKYKIPEQMFKAAWIAVWAHTPGTPLELKVEDILQAAIRWRAKNPWKPSQKECLDMEAIYRQADETEEAFLVIAEYVQRRMYLALEPKEPEVSEATFWRVVDLMRSEPDSHSSKSFVNKLATVFEEAK